MKQNKIAIEIELPIEEVFEFTTNPKNTHLWIDSIVEEVADAYPPQIGTTYKNRGKDGKWNYYLVEAFEKNLLFTLSDAQKNYFVQYRYKMLGENRTELEYFEWVEDGELEEPFSLDVLEKLKLVMDLPSK